MVVDVHAHLIVPAISRAARPADTWRPDVIWEDGRQLVDFGGRRISSALREFVAIERILEEQARAGVDITVFSPWSSLFAYDRPLAEALAVNRVQNDALAAMVSRYGERMAAIGTVPLQDVDTAVTELERLMGQLGLKGVEIATNVNGVYLGDDRFEPFWSAAAALGAVVQIHPIGGLGGPTRRQYYLWNAFANPAETALTAAHIILAGVLERHPGLKVCLVHGGGHLPYQIGRLDRAYKMRPEARERINRPPSACLKAMYFDTVVHAPAALRYLIDLVGADRVMVGSDYPFDMGSERPTAIVDTLDLSDEDREQVLAGTARALFGS